MLPAEKEVLGMYISEREGANFWLQVLCDLHNRGLQDILIACTDNLKGFNKAIQSIYTKAPRCSIDLSHFISQLIQISL